MQEKLLYDLVEELTGEGNGRIVDILYNKKDVNEFSIAKKMELTINQVRNILYKLSNLGLVSFIRKKDKRKGWYIYYWTLDTKKCLIMLESSLQNKINNLEKELEKRQTQRYYVCKYCDIEVTEEKALENDFTCEECAGLYELLDNSNYIKNIQSRITRTKKELDQIKEELVEVREKLEKKRKRLVKKQQKLAEEEKEKRKLALKKKRELNKKITKPKTTPKKKSTTKKQTTTKSVKKKTPTKKTTLSTKKTTKPKTTPKKKSTTKKQTTTKSVKKKTPTKKPVKKKTPKKKK